MKESQEWSKVDEEWDGESDWRWTPGRGSAVALNPTEQHRLPPAGTTCCESLAPRPHGALPALRQVASCSWISHGGSTRRSWQAQDPTALWLSAEQRIGRGSGSTPAELGSLATKHNSLVPLVPLTSKPHPVIMCGTSPWGDGIQRGR